MKNYKYILLLIVGLSSFLNSCEKLIDVDLPANQIDSQIVFSDVQTADAVLSGVYAGLWNNSPLSGDKMGLFLGLYTDDLDFYATASTNGMSEMYKNQLIANNPVVYAQWSSAYQQIYACNSILEGCQQSTNISDKDKKRIMGEALLIRSILFFYLQQLFGDIPYPVSTDYKINQSLAKTSSTEVLKLLESHINQSSEMLLDTYRNTERIYLNKKVAQLLLAKVYMTQEKWGEAEIALKQIVASGMYSVQTDVSKTFKKTSQNILWQLKPTNSGDATKEVIAYYFDFIPPYNYALTSNLIGSFTSTDLRRQQWITPVTVSGNTWFRATKYKNLTNNTDEYSVVFRIEEVYLLLAESLGRQGKITEALPFLNTTRLRAGLTAITSPISTENLMNEILLENRKEFFTEMGHRFYDMKRLDKLNQLLPLKANWNANFKLWPIPEKEILLNPNLNPQNNGY